MRVCILTGHLPNYAALAERTIYRNKADYCKRHGYDLVVHTETRPKFLDNQSHAGGFSWSRLEHMAELVESGNWDWVWVVGCDTLITNFYTRVEHIVALAETKEAQSAPMPACPYFARSTAPPPLIQWPRPNGETATGRKHLIICGERVTALQADSFLVRGSPEGAAYLRDILAQYPLYRHHPWVENQAMIDLRYKHAALTCIIGQHWINSYDYRLFEHINPAYGEGVDCYGNRGQWWAGDLLIHWPGVTLAQRMELLKMYEPMIIE